VTPDAETFDVLIQAFGGPFTILGQVQATYSARLPIMPLVQHMRRIPGTVRVTVDIACPAPAVGPPSPACFRGDAICDETTLCEVCAPDKRIFVGEWGTNR
jgi:hypothetical protein